MKSPLLPVLPALALLAGCVGETTVIGTGGSTEYITDARFSAPSPPVVADSRPVGVERHDSTESPPAAMGTPYHGRVLYSASKSAAPGITVEIVEAKKDGTPTDRILGTTRADGDGHFKVAPTEGTAEKVALVAAAVETSAETGGDRSTEGYQIKTRLIVLGSLPFPDPAKSNTLLIQRRQMGHGPGRSAE